MCQCDLEGAEGEKKKETIVITQYLPQDSRLAKALRILAELAAVPLDCATLRRQLPKAT